MALLTIEKIKELDIPINISRKLNNFGPASQGLVLYNDSVNLYKAIELVLTEIGGGSTASDEAAQDAVGGILLDTSTIDFTYNDSVPSITASVIAGGVNHDSLLNWVANKHIDHTTVSMLAGTGLTGGGTIAANRTFAIGNTGVTAASYGNASNVGRFTVNAQGQITGASSVPIVITSSFISNFTEAVQDLLSTTLVAGTGISLAYNDAGGLLTITANNVGTVTSVAASAPVSGFTISGSPITSSGTLVFTLNNDLLALENISTLGYAVRTATNTWRTRTILGNTPNIIIYEGNGIAGDTTIDLIPTGISNGVYGTASAVASYQVDGYGRLFTSSEIPISILASQVFDFTQEVQDVMATTLLAGTNIVITYDDLGNTIRIDASNGATGTVTGTGVAGRVAFWSGTSALSSDVDLTFDGTNLSVGSLGQVVLAPTAINLGSGTDFPISVIGGKLNLISDTTVVANGGGIVTFTPSFISTTLRTSNTTTQYNFQTTGHFAPVASGTNSFIEVHVHPIVNQTGGHTGITRGVYIDPTLTNAADFRGIEINTPGQTALKIVSGLIQFNLGTDSTGDIYYRNSLGNLDRLEIGTSSQVLIGGAIPAWGSIPGGTLPTGASAGDLIYYTGTVWQHATLVKNSQTGITGFVVTLPSIPITVLKIDVYLNGLYLDDPNDYTRIGTTLTFVASLVAGDRIITKYYI